MLIVKEMIGKSYLEGAKLKSIISRILQDLNSSKVELLCTKRDLNEEEKHQAKKTSDLSPSTSIKNGMLHHEVIL
jgi:hypothetical protein